MAVNRPSLAHRHQSRDKSSPVGLNNKSSAEKVQSISHSQVGSVWTGEIGKINRKKDPKHPFEFQKKDIRFSGLQIETGFNIFFLFAELK